MRVTSHKEEEVNLFLREATTPLASVALVSRGSWNFEPWHFSPSIM